ncbi:MULTISPECIES: hypothetical protein [Bacillus]|uniref:hypothetical protein n=1 Tax=Bacillus TaxID=1386 RepID=UPI00203C6EB4|nr:hypothetical protein [Bacillus safensis]MCM3137196.1 hypothetical protein [Bacillus safensis]UXC31257.1 hypothetical protein N4Q31_12190 [Bacillus safensis]
MKKVKLNTMTKESIADIEKEITNIALNLVKEKQAKFKDLGLTINAEFGRFVYGKKSRGREIQVSDCFTAGYNSSIYFSVDYLNGEEFHDGEEGDQGYCIDHLDIWICVSNNLVSKKGYLIDFENESDLRGMIIPLIDELYKEATEILQTLSS